MSNRKADNLLLFKSIVDCGSLSTASKICNISVSQASKRMTHLEHSLGIQLLQRSTRKMSLTPPGEALYKKLEHIKSQIDEAWQSMDEYTNEPKGKIFISSPTYFGLNNLIQYANKFHKKHPEIHVDLKLENKEQAFEETSYDITFISHPMGPSQLIPDSNLYAKKVHSEKLVYVASQSYIDEHSKPNHPEELNRHKCLTINHNSNGNIQWVFYRNQIPFKQSIDVAFETNNFEALYKAVSAGMGIAQIPMGLIKDNESKVVILFDEYTQETLDTYAYYTKNKLTSKKISLFLDHFPIETR